MLVLRNVCSAMGGRAAYHVSFSSNTGSIDFEPDSLGRLDPSVRSSNQHGFAQQSTFFPHPDQRAKNGDGADGQIDFHTFLAWKDALAVHRKEAAPLMTLFRS